MRFDKAIIRFLIAALVLLVLTAPAWATTESVTASVTAENNFTDSISPNPWSGETYGYLNISVSGTWSATVTLQRSFDDGTTWLDTDTWTSNVQTSLTDYEGGVLYRIGVKTGDFSSGTVVLRLSR